MGPPCRPTRTGPPAGGGTGARLTCLGRRYNGSDNSFFFLLRQNIKYNHFINNAVVFVVLFVVVVAIWAKVVAAAVVMAVVTTTINLHKCQELEINK